MRPIIPTEDVFEVAAEPVAFLRAFDGLEAEVLAALPTGGRHIIA